MGGVGDTVVNFEHFVENHNKHILLIFCHYSIWFIFKYALWQ